MNNTRFRKALMALCEQQPELRKKLAVEMARSAARRPQRKAASDKNYMVMRSLLRLADQAPEILDMIDGDASELEDWQEFKINLAAEYIDAVFDSLKYRISEEDL